MPSLALIVAGIAWRWPTLTHARDYDLFAMGRLAYSDVVKLYFTRDLAAHHLPYLQQSLEYPVLTGLTIWLTALLPGIRWYFLANAALLGACVAASLVLLARMCPPRALWRFALAPALAFYTVLNWDALALLALVGALYFVMRRQFLWVGVCLGIGASAKLYPLFILPIVLAYAARPDAPAGRNQHLRRAGALLGGCAAAILALNLPVALLSWQGWTFFLRFQATRDVNLDSIWANIPPVPAAVSSHIFIDVMLGGTLYLAWRVWRGAPWQPAAMLSLLLFLLFTRDYSPQYDLWLLPFLVLLVCPVRLWLVYVVADAAYYAGIFLFYYFGMPHHAAVPFPDRWATLNAVIWSRELMLASLFAWGLALVHGSTLTAWWGRISTPPAGESESWLPAVGSFSRFGWKQALGLMVTLRVGLGIVGFAAVHLQPVTIVTGAYNNLLIHGEEPWSQFFSTWQRWDGFYYQQIAEHGYHTGDGTTAFYPLYPLLSRSVSVLLVGNIVVAELLVSSAAFVVAMWLLYRLARLDVSPRAALLAVLLTACFPTGFFLLAPYTESLFLLLTVAAFWFARTGRPWLAGLAGFGAGLTRAQGAFLVLPLAFIYLRRADQEGKRVGPGLLASTLPPLALILFTAYLHVVIGETRSTLAIQSMWGYTIVAPWRAIADSWAYIGHPLDPTQGPIELLNLLSLLGFTGLAVLVSRRLPLGYSLYVWPYLALLYTRQMGLSPLMSVSRFTVVLFPCTIVLAAILVRRPWLALGSLAAGVMVMTLLFESYVHFVFAG